MLGTYYFSAASFADMLLDCEWGRRRWVDIAVSFFVKWNES